MANREIVGWFTRGGKRVPIFKGEGSGKARKVGSIKKTSDGKYEAKLHTKTSSGKIKDTVLGAYDSKDRAKRRFKTERDMIREDEARRSFNKTPKSFGNGPDGAEYARLASRKSKIAKANAESDRKKKRGAELRALAKKYAAEYEAENADRFAAQKKESSRRKASEKKYSKMAREMGHELMKKR